MVLGYVCLVLHTHMPYVRHIDIIDPLEERWLFEAMSECYIPLLNAFENLHDDNVNYKITMSLTPPILNMLKDEYLRERYINHLNKTIELTEKELIRNKNDKELLALSKFYNERFNKILSTYKKYDCNLINGFKKFENLNNLELISSSATHAILPLITNKEALKAQIYMGIKTHEEILGKSPKGMWLPECAYTYTLDDLLKEMGLKYFITESTGILYASPRPRYGTYAPIALPNGICAFGRDMESSAQVWSSAIGYPGNPSYREFYRDIGYDLPMEYIRPYINQGGIRIDTGIKYYKITGTSKKEFYKREEAITKVHEDAKHFASSRSRQIDFAAKDMDFPPIITCPYDTELFGHWWFEGPDFIESFIRESKKDNNNYALISPLDYINKIKIIQKSSPCPSTWGEHSDFSVWLNPLNDYLYKDIFKMESIMKKLGKIETSNELLIRALNQAARELMLSESSDWAFIIKHNTSVEYAKKRFEHHKERFFALVNQIENHSIDENYIKNLENIDNIFNNIDYKIYK